MLEKTQGPHEYTATSSTSTQHQCQRMLINNKSKACINTQRQTQLVHSTSCKRGCANKNQGFHQYTALDASNTQHQNQKDMLPKNKAPISTQRQTQPIHSISAKKNVQTEKQGSHHYTTSNSTSTQHQCQKRMFKQKPKFPLLHNVKPNQYTASMPKENV